MPSFEKKFNKKHRINEKEIRSRKFDPETFFHSIVNLCISNHNYSGSLNAVWSGLRKIVDTPFKSALSQLRPKISFTFFREKFEKLIVNHDPYRKTWRKLRVYGTDGDQYRLPASQDVLDAGYRGYPCKDEQETHYPRMYVVHCCDLISGVTKEFRYSNKNEEIQFALEIATTLESKSVTLYDRLFFSRALSAAHGASKSYYFARCKSGETVLAEIQEFEKSKSKKKSVIIDEREVTFLKIRNPKSEEVSIFATNLPPKYLKKKKVKELYCLRWGVETVHRDLSETMKIENWHSTKINGIQQEIYAMLWATNQARIQIARVIKKRESISPENRVYASINFKAVMVFLAENFITFAKTRSRKILTNLTHLMNRTKEIRERLSREAPKVIKYEHKKFPSASLTPRRS